MINLIEETKKALYIKRKTNIWTNSVFEFLTDGFTSDERGFWGENFFQNVIKNYTKFNVLWDKDNNTAPSDGVYDMTINKYRTEIKTAMKGTSDDNWQHDSIKEKEDWDKLVFVDLHPNGNIFFTCINSCDMVYGNDKHNIFGRKSSKCKDGHKFDFSNASHQKGISYELTIKCNVNNKDDTIKLSKFLDKHFGK